MRDPDLVLIEDQKLCGYLLALEHPVGGSKARFFLDHGFRRDDPAGFRKALKRHLSMRTSERLLSGKHGKKWIVTGPLVSPDGRNPVILSVWIQDLEGKPYRLVTAYPEGSEES